MAKIDIQQFLGKPKTYSICGRPLELEPLKGKDLDLLMGVKEGSESDGIRKLIRHYFELTDAEYDVLSVQFINEAADAITDVNGVGKKK